MYQQLGKPKKSTQWLESEVVGRGQGGSLDVTRLAARLLSPRPIPYLLVRLHNSHGSSLHLTCSGQGIDAKTECDSRVTAAT